MIKFLINLSIFIVLSSLSISVNASETLISLYNNTNRILYSGYTENGYWHGIQAIPPGQHSNSHNPPAGAQFAISENQSDLIVSVQSDGSYKYQSNVTVVKYMSDGGIIGVYTTQRGEYIQYVQHFKNRNSISQGYISSFKSYIALNKMKKST